MATKIIAAKAVTAKKMAAKTVATKTLAPKVVAKVVNKVVNKDEVVFSHPTMCLHCHLIVEMFHERGADPVRGSWQCPRCNHKYLFSHWKIKRQTRGKTEAA
jgi:hypothetical protein